MRRPIAASRIDALPWRRWSARWSGVPRFARWRPCLAALVLCLLAGTVAACSAQGSAASARRWAFEELSLRYPSSLAPGTLNVASASSSSNCLCHLVAPPSGGLLLSVQSLDLRYRGDSHSGMRIAVLNTSGDASLLTVPAGNAIPDGEAAQVFAQLDLPANDTAASTQSFGHLTVAGLPTVHATAGHLREGSQSLAQQTWILFNLAHDRAYAVTCQYTASNREAVAQACQSALDGIKVSD